MQIPYRKPGKYQRMATDPMLTRAKYEELEAKLERLRRSQPAAAAEVSRLSELGDFSENTEYQMAKGKLRGIISSIIEIENRLKHAQIIAAPQKNDRVQVGHTVIVEVGGEEKSFLILGSAETNPGGNVISHLSPIGAALLGHKVGEVVRVKLATREAEYRIKKIE